MGRLIVVGITSLDGYMNDADGNFDWSVPSEEQHLFINTIQRGYRTHIYGRKLYETMRVWEDIAADDPDPAMAEYGQIWRDADKIVVSTTMDRVETTRTTLRRDLDWLAGFVESADGDITIGGPTLAAHAIRAGLVSEFQLYVSPVLVGGGTRLFADDVQEHLELIDEHRFANGVVYVAYRTTKGATHG